MNDLDKRIRRTSIINGTILGAILLVLNIISFYIITSIASSNFMVVIGSKIFSLLIPIIVAMLFCFFTRKKIGGYWTFKQATTGIFIMFLIAYSIHLIGNDIVFEKFIEPNYVQRILNADVSAKVSIMKQRGDSQKNIDSALADLKKDFAQDKHITIWNVIMEIMVTLIFLFLFSLIFSLLLKNAEYVSVVD